MAAAEEARLRSVLKVEDENAKRVSILSALSSLLAKNSDSLKTWEKSSDTAAISALSTEVIGMCVSLRGHLSDSDRIRATGDLANLLIMKGGYEEAYGLCLIVFDFHLTVSLLKFSADLWLVKAELARMAAKMPHDSKGFGERAGRLDPSVQTNSKMHTLSRIMAGDRAAISDFREKVYIDGIIDNLLKAIS